MAWFSWKYLVFEYVYGAQGASMPNPGDQLIYNKVVFLEPLMN
jgi:hypothetical protein